MVLQNLIDRNKIQSKCNATVNVKFIVSVVRLQQANITNTNLARDVGWLCSKVKK